MIDFNMQQLFYILICLLPGYVYEHVVRYNVPHKQSSGLEYFLNLLWHSTIINALIILFYALLLSINSSLNSLLTHLGLLLSGKPTAESVAQYLCAYSLIAIIISYIIAWLHIWHTNKSAKDKLPVFTRILTEIPTSKNLFLKITLKTKEIYSGQLLYYPNEYSILTSAKFHIYLAEVYKFNNDSWEKIESDGLLVDSSEISAIEYISNSDEKKSS